MKNKTGIIAALLILCAFTAYANQIEVQLSSTDVSIAAGGTVSVDVTVKNNQNSDEMVSLVSAGAMSSWAKFSQAVATVPAGGTKTVKLTLTGSSKAPDISTLTVTASSLDTTKWDSEDITVRVGQTNAGTKVIRQTISLDNGGDSKVRPRIRLNLYLGSQVYNQKGFNIKNGDECCVGDIITSKAGVSGEFYGDGGADDSPPVESVESIYQAEADIQSGKYSPTLYKVPTCIYLLRCDVVCPQCQGLSKCDCFDLGGRENLGNVDCSCVKKLAVLCSSTCTATGTGQIAPTDNGFVVTEEGNISLSSTCGADCAVYDPQIVNSIKTFESQSTVSEGFTIKAVKESAPPNLKLSDYTHSQVKGQDVIKVDIENTGTGPAKIDSISLDIPNYKMIYAPGSLASGEKAEMVIETSASDLSSIRANVDYSAENVGCLSQTSFKAVFAIGLCKQDSDCNDNDAMTEDRCQNPGTPDAKCVNTKFETARLIDSEQTYKMDVQKGCNNTYYNCYLPATSNNPNLKAGSECYNTGDEYYTNTAERFVLKYDISGIKTGVSSAILDLQANTVNKAQDIEVYSADENWDEQYCKAEGDICSQPLCEECMSLHNIGGNKISTGTVENAATYSFDITDYLKDELSKGETIMSLQIRGNEEPSPCDKTNDWTKQSVEFDNAPILKVLY